MTVREFEPSGANPLFYRMAGNNGPKIVFLHSYLLDSRYWIDHLLDLSNEYTCYAPDLRGHGRMAGTYRRSIIEEDDAEDVHHFLASITDHEPVHLVGLSAGGIIAALSYLKAPERVKSLSLLSTNFIMPLNEPYKRYQAEMARLVVVEGIDALFRRFDEYIVGSGSDLVARARYKTMLRDQPFELFVTFLTGQAIQARPDIPSQLQVPVFLPYGEEDIVMTQENVNKLLDMYPNAIASSVPKAGRLLSLENPSALNNALTSFWSGLE